MTESEFKLLRSLRGPCSWWVLNTICCKLNRDPADLKKRDPATWTLPSYLGVTPTFLW